MDREGGDCGFMVEQRCAETGETKLVSRMRGGDQRPACFVCLSVSLSVCLIRRLKDLGCVSCLAEMSLRVRGVRSREEIPFTKPASQKGKARPSSTVVNETDAICQLGNSAIGVSTQWQPWSLPHRFVSLSPLYQTRHSRIHPPRSLLHPSAFPFPLRSVFTLSVMPDRHLDVNAMVEQLRQRMLARDNHNTTTTTATTITTTNPFPPSSPPQGLPTGSPSYQQDLVAGPQGGYRWEVRWQSGPQQQLRSPGGTLQGFQLQTGHQGFLPPQQLRQPLQQGAAGAGFPLQMPQLEGK